ncbi:hypothetical protein LCGC14_1487570 [marine sediment metagenome]|uniref:Uncharacterized protein n=1 Tax=marine sediment metagenome TaxID=412755 RepID=A0A0F9JTM0_9ZZZZ
MTTQEKIREEIQKREKEIAIMRFYIMNKWQFVCDSVYDLFFLRARFGQKTLRGWWEVRLAEWFGWWEYNRRWGNK